MKKPQVQSLAVKYRPTSIMGFVGQESVVTQVSGMLLSKRMPSAMLICGHTGCGKTTLSRIIARSINCSNLDRETFEPCGECRSCQLGENSPDYTEVNIGDERGIDSIRQLCQAAKSMPVVGNTRVIVLDEVHQLLAAGANAMLKTLEEAPPKTLWILATTNPEKLLPTIRGRCAKLVLTQIRPTVIAKQLFRIAKREGVSLKSLDNGELLVQTITDLSGGSMREAISLLESAIYAIQGSGEVDLESIIKAFSSTGEAELESGASTILAAMFSGDLRALVKVCRTASNARGLIQKLRWLVQYLIDADIGIATYQPYSAKLFKQNKVRTSLDKLLLLQHALVELEDRLNRMSVDETVVLLSSLGNLTSSVQNK